MKDKREKRQGIRGGKRMKKGEKTERKKREREKRALPEIEPISQAEREREGGRVVLHRIEPGSIDTKG